MRNFLLFISFFSSLFLQAQRTGEERITTWKGFKKIEFTIDSFPAFYIEPVNAIRGNPWVWRAHFPNWHTEMDSILLERGFHVAYINTNNLYGHPKAMIAWDNFYEYLVRGKGFAPRVALEGVSRGGLYVYGWAKRNPSKVSCIYTEAAVCDFTSWPGGKGKGKGSPKDWEKLLHLYGLTEQEALQFDDQPKDHLEALASFKVPVLHVIGLKDSIVPAEENSFVLVNNYLRYGGPAAIIPMTRGRQEPGGHHFPIEDPSALADFVYRHSVPVRQPLKAERFMHRYGHLNNALYRIQKEQKATVAFLGGSITHMKGWRDKVMQYLQEWYPQTKFTFINAGIPSLGSVPHAFRLQQDVLSKGRVDLMFVESAVNDHVNGTTETRQRKALEGIIRHALRSNPYMDMVLMAFADEDKMADYRLGKIPLEVRVHDDIARHYHLPFIDLAEEVNRRIAQKEFSWEDDFKNLHPSPFGMEIYFNTIKTLLRKEWIGAAVEKPVRAQLPAPLEKNNYAGEGYVTVNQAANKKGFVVDPSWKPSDSTGVRAGFVNLPVLEGNKPGNGFDFSFQGTSVGIAVLAGPDAGIINYRVDGGPPQKADLYTRWSKNLHLPWYVLLGDDLKKGKHTVHISISQERNRGTKGNAVRIVYFLVNQ